MIFHFSKNNKMIFSLAWNTTFTEYGKVLVLNFSEMGNTVFFDPKKWCKMIFCWAWNTTFTDYWKVLVLNFWKMRNTVFFCPKSWWKDDIYLVFLKFSMIFQDLKSMVFGAVCPVLSLSDSQMDVMLLQR